MSNNDEPVTEENHKIRSRDDKIRYDIFITSLVAQYEALRSEILQLHSSVVRLLSLGVTSIPLIVGASLKFEIAPVLYISPLIVGVFALILLFQQNAIMRVGRYIRTIVEPKLLMQECIGWEYFLEMDPRNRMAEKCFAHATYSTFGIFYLGGIVFAFYSLKKDFNLTLALSASTLYLSAFFVFLYLVIRYFPVSNLLPGESLVPLEQKMI